MKIKGKITASFLVRNIKQIMDICVHGNDVSITGEYRNASNRSYTQQVCQQCRTEEAQGFPPQTKAFMLYCTTPDKCWPGIGCGRCKKVPYNE